MKRGNEREPKWKERWRSCKRAWLEKYHSEQTELKQKIEKLEGETELMKATKENKIETDELEKLKKRDKRAQGK